MTESIKPKLSSPVCHIAPSRREIVATAQFERTVSIWDLKQHVKLAEFDTILDYGGQRLILDHEGRFCITAAYHVHGIACYNARDGGVVWQHKNLKKAQILTVSRNGELVFCGFDEKSCVVLEINSGIEVTRLRGVRSVFESPYQPLRLLDKMVPEIQEDDGTLICKIKRLKFSFLSITFAPDTCCISEVVGPVRCFDLKTSLERWRYTPPQGSHVLRLGYSNRTGLFYGVEWPYQHGGDKKLLRLDPRNGETHIVSNLGQVSKTEFCLDGNFILTSDGNVVDLSTGKLTNQLPFIDKIL